MGGAYRWWRRVAAAAVGAVLAAATLVGCGSDAAGPVMLHLFTNAQDADQDGIAAVECSRASGGRYMIAQQAEPIRGSNDQRLQLARRLAIHDPSLDIMELDVDWTAEFAQAGWILPYPPEVARQIRQGTLRAPLDTGTYLGKLYAAPLGVGVQLLWYRKDLVSHPPRTWDEMIQMAESLAARGLPHYVEVQGGLFEGLTVWFNTLLASGGGVIVSENGDVRVAQGDAARQALGIMRRVAISAAADPSLPLSNEDNARLAMQAGTAAFEVNYPFVYASMQQDGGGTFIDSLGRPTEQNTGRRVGDVFGWAPYPAITVGMPARVTVGGVNLGVRAASRHPVEAFEAVQCLRDRANQLRNALGMDRSPTLAALYDDPAFQKRYPAWREIRDTVDSAAVRPKTPAYSSISIVISHLLNPPAKINPDTLVGQLADQIGKAVESQGVVP
jgi:multiple sugar transport system substrate-binding protein